MIRRPPRSTQSRSSAASDVYKRQEERRPEEALRPRKAGVHEEGRRKRDDDRERAAEKDEDERVLERGQEDRVGEERPVVRDACDARIRRVRERVELSLIHISEPTRL